MANNENLVREEKNNLGSIRIADEVVKIIAGLAATEVPGIVAMSSSVVGGIAEMLGRKNMSKGVKVEVGEKEAAVDMYVVMEYGTRIPDVAAKVQESVKNAIETMTGLTVVEVNVNVQDVTFGSEPKEEDHRVK